MPVGKVVAYEKVSLLLNRIAIFQLLQNFTPFLLVQTDYRSNGMTLRPIKGGGVNFARNLGTPRLFKPC